MGFHNTSDNPREYRKPAEEVAARHRDPIDRLGLYAIEHESWSKEQEERLRARGDSDVEAAYRLCAELPAPGAADIFDHVSSELPPRVALQRRSAIDGSR